MARPYVNYLLVLKCLLAAGRYDAGKLDAEFFGRKLIIRDKSTMTLIETLPLIATGLTLIIGLVNFFHPRLMLSPMKIEFNSPMAMSEARAVFGGMNLGMAVAALTLGEPAIFTALGIAWGTLTLARFWSIAVDGIGFKASIPPLVVDGTLCFLFLSPVLLA